MELGQLWLRIGKIHVGGAAVLEQRDHRLGLGLEMSCSWVQIPMGLVLDYRRLPTGGFLSQHQLQGDRADAHPYLLQPTASLRHPKFVVVHRIGHGSRSKFRGVRRGGG